MKKRRNIHRIERSLSFRRIKSQKKYSLFLLVIMVLTCMLMQTGFQMSYGIQNTYLEIRKDTYGEWERFLSEVDSKTESSVNENPFIEDKGSIKIYGVLGGDYTENKQCNIGSLDKGAWDLGRLTLEEGRLPETEHEIAMERSTLVSLGYEDSLGEEITLRILSSVNFKSREAAEAESSDYVYTLCGIIKDYQVNWELSGRHRLPTGIVTAEGGKRIGDPLVAHMLIRARDDSETVYQDLEESGGINCGIEENTNLEEFSASIPYKTFLDQIRLLVAGAAVCILFVTIAHSIDERERSWKFLNALGMEPRQMYQMIFWEALLYFTVSILFGTIGGLALYQMVLPAFEAITSREIQRQFSLPAAGSSLLCSALVIGISYFFSCMKLKKYLSIGLKRQQTTGKIKKAKTSRKIRTIHSSGFTPFTAAIHQWGYAPVRKALQVFLTASVFFLIGLGCFEVSERMDSLKWMKQTNGNSYYLHTDTVSDSLGIKKGVVESLSQIAGVESVAAYYTTDKDGTFTIDLSDYSDSVYLKTIVETEQSYAGGENTAIDSIRLTALGVDQWQDIERFLNNLSEGSITREQFDSGDFCILVLPPLGEFKTYDENNALVTSYLPSTSPDLKDGIEETTIKTGDSLRITHWNSRVDEENVAELTDPDSRQIQIDAILRTMRYEDTYTPLLGSSGITIITGTGFWKNFGLDSVEDYYQIAKVTVSDDAEALDTEAHITRILKKASTIQIDNNYEQYKTQQQNLYSFVGMFGIFAVFYLIFVSLILYQMAEADAHEQRKNTAIFKMLGMEDRFLKKIRRTELVLILFLSAIAAALVLFCYYLLRTKN